MDLILLDQLLDLVLIEILDPDEAVLLFLRPQDLIVQRLDLQSTHSYLLVEQLVLLHCQVLLVLELLDHFVVARPAGIELHMMASTCTDS